MKNKYGLILRAFSRKERLVPQTVQQVLDVVQHVQGLKIQRWPSPVFSRIDIIVNTDRRYPDHDCGQTSGALISELSDYKSVFVHTLDRGDLFVGALNYGMRIQAEAGIDMSLNLSHGVRSYLTPNNLELMLEAMEEPDVLVTGLAIPPFEDSILKGRILDTCDMWKLRSISEVGLYDPRGAQPFSNDRSGWVKSWSEAGEEWTYATAGVEEMFPLIEMVRRFGPCIAPIKPIDQGQWVLPDDPDIKKREEKKIRSKYERQVRAAHLCGVDLSFLEGGIVPRYRNR